MRLLISSGIFPPEIGGPATHTNSLALWLHRKGHEVVVVAAVKKTISRENFQYPLVGVRKKGLFFWRLRAFLKILKISKDVNMIFINGLLFESVAAAWIRRRKYLCRLSGDLIWERAVRRKWTRKDFTDFQTAEGNFEVKLLRIIRKSFLNGADRIIVPSLYLGRIAENWGVNKDKIVVIKNPYSEVKIGKITLPVSFEDKFVVSTGGRLVVWKGIDRVIQVVKKLEGCYLIIIGAGPEREYLECLVENLQLKERIFFTGAISRSRVKKVFYHSDCFVLNSKYEGLSMIIMEAMAAGCPVITTNIGGNPEIIRNEQNGLLLEPDDEVGMFNWVMALINNRDLKKTLASRGKQTIKKEFNRENLFQKLESVIEECINVQK